MYLGSSEAHSVCHNPVGIVRRPDLYPVCPKPVATCVGQCVSGRVYGGGGGGVQCVCLFTRASIHEHLYRHENPSHNSSAYLKAPPTSTRNTATVGKPYVSVQFVPAHAREQHIEPKSVSLLNEPTCMYAQT